MALDNTLSIIFESYKKLAQMLTDEEMVYLVDVMCRQLHGDAKYYGIMPQKE
jgi:predicted transcriptional regulator